MGFLKKLFGSGKKEDKKVGSNSKSFKYLDDLIHSGMKEIVLDSDIVIGFREDSDYEEGIRLDVDDLVIDGNGHSIDAKMKTRIFYCTGKNITIKNITLKNGFAHQDGGAIENSGTLTISDSTLTGNKVINDGGAICNANGGTLTVSGSAITGNAAKVSGGAIYNYGRGTLSVFGSAITGNTAKDYGGAIYNREGMTISDSTLEGNAVKSKDAGGGAIYNEGKMTVSGSTLTGNMANDGGAIDNSGELSVFDSTLTGNTAKGNYGMGGAIYNSGELSVSDSTLDRNAAKGKFGAGGAIYNSGELSVSDSILKGNTAKGKWGMGGAIGNIGGLSVSDSTLTGNTAEKRGGAIENGCNFNANDCHFSNNKSPTSIIHNKDSLQFFNSNFMSNNASNIIVNGDDLANVSIAEGEFKDNDIKESIIFNEGKSCTVERTVFEKHPFNTIINKSNLTLVNPKIKDEGKKILNEKHILIRKSSDGLEDKIYGDGTVESERYIPSQEKSDFGSLYKIIHESKTKEIMLEEDISFEDYETDYYEGGIELDIDSLIIDGNGHTIDAQDKTRIFYCTGKNITIKNITFKNGRSHRNYSNPFNSHGGAIKISHDANLTIENCKFINNTSEENGGVISNRGKLTVSSSTFTENTSEGKGGTISNFKGELTVSGSTFTKNTAQGYYSGGGAISNFKGELTVSGSTFAENTVQGVSVECGGGAIINCGGELTVSGSILTGNKTRNKGGAIYSSNRGMLTVSDSTLTENTSMYGGGAIYNIKCNADVSGSTLKGNIVEDGEGGSIYSWDGRLSVSDSTLRGNAAQGGDGKGGAIYHGAGALSLSDSIIAENRAKRRGGVIYLYWSEGYKSNNCTFENNKPNDVREKERY